MTAEAIRSFNRTYTPRIGVLDDSFLGSGRPLGPSRLLFEVGLASEGGAAVADLRARLGLDSGYLSRLLRGLESDGLLVVSTDEGDGRRRTAVLTSAGRREWGQLDRRSERLARHLVAPLTTCQQARLDAALREAESLIRLASMTIDHVDPTGPEAASSQQAYFDELDARFTDGFDPGDTIAADAHHYEPPMGRFLVARSGDDAVAACGALQAVDHTTAEIKRMWVAPGWRGFGLGRRLLGELEVQAADAGYERVVLDTNASLTEAITMYGTAGYDAVERYNDNPYAERWFAKSLAPVVRLARPEDVDGITGLILAIQRDEFGVALTLDDQPDLVDIDGAYRSVGGEFWVAAWRGDVVGTVALVAVDDEHLALRKLFLRRDHRASGLGTRLLDTALDWARNQAVDAIILGTTAVMTSAHAFYERNGFARIEPGALPPAFPRMAVDSAFYRRDV